MGKAKFCAELSSLAQSGCTGLGYFLRPEQPAKHACALSSDERRLRRSCRRFLGLSSGKDGFAGAEIPGTGLFFDEYLPHGS